MPISNSALISIDMQNDFVLPDGTMCTEGALEMVPALSTLIEKYRQQKRPIVHVVRLYNQDGSNADMCRRARLQNGESLVIPESYGAQIVDGLLPDYIGMDCELLLEEGVQFISEKEIILYKPRWSAFFQTDLHYILQEWSVNTLAIAGTWFFNCVHQTIYDGSSYDYHTIAVRDCIAGLDAKGCEGLKRVECEVVASKELR
ncbi:MAG: cysteine hydrolase family protein [Desulfovibrio sp.]